VTSVRPDRRRCTNEQEDTLNKRLGTIAAASAIGLVGVTGVVVTGAALMPASAAETTEEGTAGSEEQSFLAERLQRIKEALSGLVGDGVITQDQADRVADTLNGSDALGPRHGHGPGGHGHGGFGAGIALEAAAEALGITEDELRAALADGSTLADVAEEQGVARDTLVDALVAAATERLDQAVTDGRITAERRDEIVAELPERIADAVDRQLSRFGGHGMRDLRGDAETSSLGA
jgi:hypothetical protein